MSIATPCSMNWEGMKGDDRTRYCDLCSLHVYNVSEMSSREVKTLIASTEGRFCARLYRRADGTVITRDCPVGLRAIRRHVSKVAGAVVTTVFSFCMAVMGQAAAQEDKSCPNNAKVTIERTQDNGSLIKGVLVDPNGAVITGATVTLIDQTTKQELKTITDEDGAFEFTANQNGSYDINVNAIGFKPLVVNQIKVENSQALTLELHMTVPTDYVLVGLMSLPFTQMDAEGPGLKKTIDEKQIKTLPF